MPDAFPKPPIGLHLAKVLTGFPWRKQSSEAGLLNHVRFSVSGRSVNHRVSEQSGHWFVRPDILLGERPAPSRTMEVRRGGTTGTGWENHPRAPTAFRIWLYG